MGGINSEAFNVLMVQMLSDLQDDDPCDQEWKPKLARKKKSAKNGPRKAPSFGPDVIAKSARSQRRPKHQRAIHNQSQLTTFSFTLLSGPQSAEKAENMSSARPIPALPPPPPPPLELPPSPSPAPAPTSPAIVAPPCSSPTPPPLSTPATCPSVHKISQTQSAQADPDPTFHNLGHKRRRCDSSPVHTNHDSASESEDAYKEPGGDGGDIWVDSEEEMVDAMLGARATDPEPKDDIRSWKDLREQLKDDIINAHKKHARLTSMNQLLLLRNFATLRIKGIGRMAASHDIARQWHEGEGIHFARRVRILARHYQLYEQLPTQNVGGYRGYSIFNDER
ncbi:hypothetical protein BJY52DRAFT_1230983, partial [Lactarius psammicola]